MQGLNWWPSTSTRSDPPTNQTAAALAFAHTRWKGPQMHERCHNFTKSDLQGPAPSPNRPIGKQFAPFHFSLTGPDWTVGSHAPRLHPSPQTFINLEFWHRSDLIHYASHSSFSFWLAPPWMPTSYSPKSKNILIALQQMQRTYFQEIPNIRQGIYKQTCTPSVQHQGGPSLLCPNV